MRSGCRGFESRSGHLIFSSSCSVYIDRHIRVDLSDDEQDRSNSKQKSVYVRFVKPEGELEEKENLCR